MRKRIMKLSCGLLAVSLLAGCGGGSAGESAPQEDRPADSVVVAMGPTSEPEAGIDPA